MNRLLKQLPRLIAATAVWLLLTAAITYAAAPTAAPKAAPAAPKLAVPTTLVVPDVRGQIYVFAKGMLEDAGFAWRVSGPVQGYAVNTVAAQTPAPGTRVLDTGSPTIRLRLAHGTYAQAGTPEDAAPFAGTRLRLAEAR
jgi:beta-lactam-binding protein with PASTA domain